MACKQVTEETSCRVALQDAINAAVSQRLEAPAAQQRMERAVLERDSTAVRHLLQTESASLEEHTLMGGCAASHVSSRNCHDSAAALAQEGLLPIHVAAAAGHADMLGVLGVLGASCNAGTRESGDTPLHLAAAGGRQECLEVLLGPLGARPDLINKDGRTPLNLAAQSGNVPALAALLAAGAHRSAQDKEGQRPVDLAGAANAHEAVAYLDGLDARAQGDKLRKYRKWAA